MSLFNFRNYRDLLKDRIAKHPHKGRGQARALAAHLRVHPTVMSHIFRGQRELSEEQAIDVAEYFELSPVETKYFRLLVRLENAGSAKLKQAIQEELSEIRLTAKKLVTRVAPERILGDSDCAIFYSSWLFAACRLYCSTFKNGCSADDLAVRFGISRVRVLEIMAFLVKTGLCLIENEKYRMGTQSTFVAKESPYLGRHHANWRLQGLRAFEEISDDSELMFTGVMSISHSDLARIREKISDFLSEFSITVKNSPPQELACLNIDFFRIRK